MTGFLGGAAVIRARAFDDVGRYPAVFAYAMEETDLALRLADHGWTIHYDGRPAVFHPATEPGRHPRAAEHTMRNRVWLAHRNLPAGLAVLYVLDWLAISAARPAPRRRPGTPGDRGVAYPAGAATADRLVDRRPAHPARTSAGRLTMPRSA